MCYVNSCAVKINICVTISKKSVNNSIQLIHVSLFAFVVAFFRYTFGICFRFPLFVVVVVINNIYDTIYNTSR